MLRKAFSKLHCLHSFKHLPLLEAYYNTITYIPK